MFEFFKLIAATKADYDQLMWLLQSKHFYPDSTSSPALPSTPDITGAFDYRELMIMIGLDRIDGSPIVRTRTKMSEANFGVLTVPTADWTGRYRLGSAPTVTGISIDMDPSMQRTSKVAFLSYNYPNPNPGEI